MSAGDIRSSAVRPWGPHHWWRQFPSPQCFPHLNPGQYLGPTELMEEGNLKTKEIIIRVEPGATNRYRCASDGERVQLD